jgi:hypothetical protein
MYLNVREDYQAELYGLSQYSSDKYDFIAPNFKKYVFARSARHWSCHAGFNDGGLYFSCGLE